MSEEKIPEESVQEAMKSRSAKFAADAKQLDKLFYEKVEQEKFADAIYEAMKSAGGNPDELMSSKGEPSAMAKRGTFI